MGVLNGLLKNFKVGVGTLALGAGALSSPAQATDEIAETGRIQSDAVTCVEKLQSAKPNVEGITSAVEGSISCNKDERIEPVITVEDEKFFLSMDKVTLAFRVVAGRHEVIGNANDLIGAVEQLSALDSKASLMATNVVVHISNNPLANK